MKNKLVQLKRVLLAWRLAEKRHAAAVLTGSLRVDELSNVEFKALRELRLFVDSEPWTELEQE